MRTTAFKFAHITDIHITDHENTSLTLGVEAPRLLHEMCKRFNKMDDLDFVLITGDALDGASEREVATFHSAILTLAKPWYFVPGNHDGYISDLNREAMRPREAAIAIDPRLAEYDPDANQAFWSREVLPGIQVIGLDSRIANDWSGTISPQQLDWLRRELDSNSYQDLVIVMVHHPIHRLAPIDGLEWWEKFILMNGRIVERQLDIHANVKLVVSGHHHCNHLSLRNDRLHMVTAALTGYPCSYRIVNMMQNEDGWYAHIETDTIADEETMDKALQLMLTSSIAGRFNEYDPGAWVSFARGTDKDLQFEGLIEGHSYE